MQFTSENCGLKESKTLVLIFDTPLLFPPDKKGEKWTLAADWEVHWLGTTFKIPIGTKTDGASIPVWLRPICGDPMEVPRLYAAIVHDYFYATHKCVYRDVADDLYRDMLVTLRVPKFKAWIEWQVIRWAGWLYWHKIITTKQGKTNE